MNNLADDFIAALEGALVGSTRLLIQELAAQGHKNTGKLADSMTVDVKIEGRSIVGEVSSAYYLEYVNRRTKHSRITKAQIEGLTKYFTERGLSGTDLQNAVWGTARKQVETGSPTAGSYRFSSNGRRTGAIQAAFDSVPEIIARELSETIQMHISRSYLPAINGEIKRV